MKINGKIIEGANEVICVIPRGNEELVFVARAVLDYTIFEGVCPEPVPPTKMKPGQAPEPDYENQTYTEQLDAYASKKFQYMIIKSLEATEGLEWDTVDIEKHETWDNYEADFKKACFTDREIIRIVGIVMEANSLDDRKIDEATKRFLLLKAQAKE